MSSNFSRVLVLAGLVIWASPGVGGPDFAQAEQGTEGKDKRPFYEFPGNYGDQVNHLKAKFKESFGYELMDLEAGWAPEEIEKTHRAFSQLPESFYRLPGLKGFYRLNKIHDPAFDNASGEVPAAAWPKFTTVYRSALKTYIVNITEDVLRVEFYNALFFESQEDFDNIVHHEMAHIFDMVSGFLSFQEKWLDLTRFRIINYPPLDAKHGGDFLFIMMNDAREQIYAPVSTRHIPTYSRENPQEDFANSAAAYIHYQYFQFSHPKRYAFMKEHVFKGKEYFSRGSSAMGFREIIMADLRSAVENKDWDRVVRTAREMGRSRAPLIEPDVVDELRKAIEEGLTHQDSLKIVQASCYLYDPSALKLRQDMARKKMVSTREVLKIERCFRMGSKVFELDQANWSVARLYFFREGGRDFIQFLDPALLTAHSRGFETTYEWKIASADSPRRILSRGKIKVEGPVTGAVKIDLADSAGPGYGLPEGEILVLELRAERVHQKPFKRFVSPAAPIRFVVQPWFKYEGPSPPSLHVNYPSGMMPKPKQDFQPDG